MAEDAGRLRQERDIVVKEVEAMRDCLTDLRRVMRETTENVSYTDYVSIESVEEWIGVLSAILDDD